jgi:hypothetical protein
MKRTLTTLTAVLLLASAGAFAQAPAAPFRPAQSPFSPFVYDALGATPKIQLHKARTAQNAPKAQAARNDSAPAVATADTRARGPRRVTRDAGATH